MCDKNFQRKLFFVVDEVTTVNNDLYILYLRRASTSSQRKIV